MLVIKVTLRAGRTAEQKKALAKALTRAAARLLGEPEKNIRLVYYEVAPEDWFVAGEPLPTRPSTTEDDDATRS